ncbi:MAG: patatin-like phospholipase family protein [Candidatus Dormiibacterota bacterium]
MKVGLVLGAGGVMGGAWITGGLEALARETGWDPGSADYVVGTSAGSMMGTLVASGIPPWFMVAHSQGRNFDGLAGADGQPAASADRSAGARYHLGRGIPWLVLGSPQLALNSLTRRGGAGAYGLLLSLGPRGVVSTEPLKEIVRRVVPEGWSPHPNLWLVATDYATGKRAVFGRRGSPRAELADAVAASCAVPSFYQPVKIGGRLYIDGGVNSVSNLDLLAGRDLDLVICLNPMSSRYRPKGFRPLPRLQALLRSGAGRRLGQEARLVREGGTKVALLQPTVPDLRLMGTNWLSGRKRHAVIEQAIETVGAQLRAPEMRQLLEGLPPGESYRVKEPTDIPVETWSEIVGVGAAPRRKSA